MSGEIIYAGHGVTPSSLAIFEAERIAKMFWKTRLMTKIHVSIPMATGAYRNRQAQRAWRRDTKGG
jgi:hypothetical protein